MGTINADNLTTILEFKDDIFWISDAPGKLTRVELGESFTTVSFDDELWESQILLTSACHLMMKIKCSCLPGKARILKSGEVVHKDC